MGLGSLGELLEQVKLELEYWKFYFFSHGVLRATFFFSLLVLQVIVKHKKSKKTEKKKKTFIYDWTHDHYTMEHS